jgi:hypothetical protein
MAAGPANSKPYKPTPLARPNQANADVAETQVIGGPGGQVAIPALAPTMNPTLMVWLLPVSLCDQVDAPTRVEAVATMITPTFAARLKPSFVPSPFQI